MTDTSHAGDRLEVGAGTQSSQPTRASIAVNPWTPDQLAFQAWLALPPVSREPRSQQALARQLEVAEETLSRWKKLPGWADAVYGLALERVKGALVPVLDAQVKQAKLGSLPHAMWLFELAGKWSPKQRHEVGGTEGGPVRIVIEIVPDRSLLDELTSVH